jgi:hypothetical protein
VLNKGGIDMKNILFKTAAFSMMAVSALAFTSCHSNDDAFDVMGNPNNLFYIKANSASSVSSPNTLAFEVVHTPVGDFGDVLAKYPVHCLKPVSATTKVKAVLDNSLIDAYNTKYGTTYVKFPDGVIDASKLDVTMKKDSVICSDSLTLSITNENLAKLTEKAYLAPIRITSVEGSNGEGSEDYGIAYMVVTTSTKLIKDKVGSADMLGKRLKDYTGWTATVDGSEVSMDDVTDGSVWSGWDFGQTGTIQIDMKEVKQFTGIRSYSYYGNYFSWGYYFKKITLSLSEDGNTWIDAGSATNSTMKDEGGYQYLCLYGAVKARYLKIIYECNSSWATGLYEFGVYTK